MNPMRRLFALATVAGLAVLLVGVGAVGVTACGGGSPTCAPLAPHDAGGCNTSYGVDYDPAVSTGCTFDNGTGTAATCLALCGQPSSCDLLTFTSVICDVPCGD